MSNSILEVVSLQKSFGGVHATDNVNLDVRENEVHAIIGPNGAGKTTLISQLSGALHSDSGKITFAGQNITRLQEHKRSRLGLARSFQITSIFLDMPVIDNVALAVQAGQGHSYKFWKPASKDKRLTGPAEDALEKVGLLDRRDTIARELSHGEHRQLEIAMALSTNPRMLLLDEPMAGMGPEESVRLVEILQTLRGEKSILLIEHDMDAVFALADRVTVLVYGRVIACGTPNEIRDNKQVRHAYLGEGDE
ncbi:MAG: ABC transporter ATP-binding protein [Fimbriimonadaceae bacterium]|nr:ABC transporter ATP-binding protein [Alphaproteobacteria bacterium]